MTASERATPRCWGEAAVPALVELLEDEDAQRNDALREGWPPIHAVELLADLKVDTAIEPILRVLANTDRTSQRALRAEYLDVQPIIPINRGSPNGAMILDQDPDVLSVVPTTRNRSR
jgi:xanthine dehydrogenase molybdopterin-binding subunit B